MVKVNKITTPRDLYNKDGFVGTCETYSEVLDVQLQIAENKLEGYYFLWNNMHIFIKPDGEFKSFPYGFDITTMQLIEIVRLRMGKTTTPDQKWKTHCQITEK